MKECVSPDVHSCTIQRKRYEFLLTSVDANELKLEVWSLIKLRAQKLLHFLSEIFRRENCRDILYLRIECETGCVCEDYCRKAESWESVGRGLLCVGERTWTGLDCFLTIVAEIRYEISFMNSTENKFDLD